MRFIHPDTLPDALVLKAEHPEAVAIQGGTDVMVDLNFDRSRPEVILDLGGVEELTAWTEDGGEIRLGAGVPYERIVRELAERLPGLALASRTVGSPQIRNRGTVGGNLGSASPAGDAHPPLLAARATVEVAAAAAGSRRIAIDEFFVGPKRHAMRPDELIVAVHVPVARGPEQFSKIGTRNAMVIAAVSFGLSIDPEVRRVGTGIGSAGPTPLRAQEAEDFLAGVLDERDAWEPGSALDDATLTRFGELVAGAARPIDDVRATRAYRVHALSVMARRTLAWARESNRGS
jgi:CO/xanthine dehydrogenase FAD-binding subunit